MWYRSASTLGAGVVGAPAAMGLWPSPAAAASLTSSHEAHRADTIENVPGVSAEWYRSVVDFAAETPSWLQSFAAFYTEAVIVLLGGLMLLCWWRARQKDARSMALALFGPVAVVFAYGVSEVAKLIVQAQRPCRALSDVVTVVDCPPPGDWSFPSNHSVIAGAAMAGIFLAWRGLGPLAAVLALSAAASRVFVGAHYPHDVVVGLVLGALVATVVSLSVLRWTTMLVAKLREHRMIGPLLVAPDTDLRPLSEEPTQLLPRQDSESPTQPLPRQDPPERPDASGGPRS